MISEEPVVATNGVVAMPIKTTTIQLDEIGYPGWECTMRTNPRSERFDALLAADGENTWNIFSEFFIKWNFGDEKGNLMPLPPATKRGDLPTDVPTFLLNKYFEAFNSLVGFPKAPSENSEATS
jgi:hypothetical protein